MQSEHIELCTVIRPSSVLPAVLDNQCLPEGPQTCSAFSAQYSYAKLFTAEGLPNLEVLSKYPFLVLAAPHSRNSWVDTAGYCKADCGSGFISFHVLNRYYTKDSDPVTCGMNTHRENAYRVGSMPSGRGLVRLIMCCPNVWPQKPWLCMVTSWSCD